MTIALEMQFSGSGGAWTDVWSDVRSDVPVSIQYGISGVGPFDHIADTGTMSFALNNAQSNSSGSLGYYSPGSGTARSGFEIGINARLAVTYGGSTFYKFVGRLSEITPESGRLLSRRTHCTATDWLEEANNLKLRRMGPQINLTCGSLFGLVASAIQRPPTASSINTGQDELSIAGDTWKDEKTTIYEALADITMSEWGYMYVKGDTSTGGVLTFEDRLARVRNTTVTAILVDKNLQGLEIERTRDTIINRFGVEAHRRLADTPTATCILYTLEKPLFLSASTTASVVGNYIDPLEFSKRVGGASMISPASGVDYTFTSEESGSILGDNRRGQAIVSIACMPGIDMSSALQISASFGANSVQYALTNPCPVHGYVTQLIARGRGLYDYNVDTYLTDNASSVNTYGVREETIDMPLQTSINVGKDVGDYLLSWLKDPHYVVNRVTFFGDEAILDVGGIGTMKIGDTFIVGVTTTNSLTAGLKVEPGSKISIAESVTGIGQIYDVNGVEIEITPGNTPHGVELIKFTFSVVQADTTHYWVLNTDALDEGTKLAY